jgi:hypothetical protein
MAFTLQHDPEHGIATLVFSGTITNNDLLGSSTECIALQKATGCLRYLIESIASLAVTSVDIYALPTREYPRNDLDRRTRIAIVQPESDEGREAAQFYESACRNRGWNTRMHPDRERAVAWLVNAA